MPHTHSHQTTSSRSHPVHAKKLIKRMNKELSTSHRKNMPRKIKVKSLQKGNSINKYLSMKFIKKVPYKTLGSVMMLGGMTMLLLRRNKNTLYSKAEELLNLIKKTS